MKWRTLHLLILCTPQSKGYPGSDSVCIAHSDSPGYPLDEKYIYDRFVRPPTIYFFQNGKGIQKTHVNQYASFCIFQVSRARLEDIGICCLEFECGFLK